MFRPVTSGGAPPKPKPKGEEDNAMASPFASHAWDEPDKEAEALLLIVNILEKTTAMGADVIDSRMKGRILRYLNHRYANALILISNED